MTLQETRADEQLALLPQGKLRGPCSDRGGEFNVKYFLNMFRVFSIISLVVLLFVLSLYSGDKMWEGIWNKTHFSGIEFLPREITQSYHISR